MAVGVAAGVAVGVARITSHCEEPCGSAALGTALGLSVSVIVPVPVWSIPIEVVLLFATWMMLAVVTRLYSRTLQDGATAPAPKVGVIVVAPCP